MRANRCKRVEREREIGRGSCNRIWLTVSHLPIFIRVCRDQSDCDWYLLFCFLFFVFFFFNAKDAANDAHCALTVHKSIMAIAIENGITLSPADYTRSVTDTNNAIASPVEAITTATVSPQQLRAYNMWHHHRKPLNVMCIELTSRGEPLKESTVMWASFYMNYLVALLSDLHLRLDMAITLSVRLPDNELPIF